MADGTLEEFQAERARLNELVMRYADINIKRFFNIDTQVYKDGALPAGMKELMGLACSLVLRCSDCITYHIARCRELGISDGELKETLAIALVAGGSVTIPQLRKALAVWDEATRAGRGHSEGTQQQR